MGSFDAAMNAAVAVGRCECRIPNTLVSAKGATRARAQRYKTICESGVCCNERLAVWRWMCVTSPDALVARSSMAFYPWPPHRQRQWAGDTRVGTDMKGSWKAEEKKIVKPIKGLEVESHICRPNILARGATSDVEGCLRKIGYFREDRLNSLLAEARWRRRSAGLVCMAGTMDEFLDGLACQRSASWMS